MRDSRSWQHCCGISPVSGHSRAASRRAPLALALLALLFAQVAEARWYQVEVVVFRQPPGIATGGEQWLAPDELPDYGRAVRLVRDLPSLDDEPAPGGSAVAPGPVAFEPLPGRERRLAGVARRVDGGGYELLLAAGWRQPGFGVARPKYVYLSDRDDAPAALPAALPDAAPEAVLPAPRIQGTVAIKVARLLHVELDFLYDHEGVPVRLHETRKLKLREIHYFDHPLFGVVVQVSPYVLPTAPETAEVGADEPEDTAPAGGTAP